MAQQQLLLLMLVVIIVGVAVMTGTGQFGKDFNAAMQDEMRKAILDIAARAQLWYRTPDELGGSRSFLDFSLEKIHYDASNLIGTVNLTNKQTGSFRITGALHEDSNWNLIVDVYPDSLAVAQ
jgi:hypothetical protein